MKGVLVQYCVVDFSITLFEALCTEASRWTVVVYPYKVKMMAVVDGLITTNTSRDPSLRQLHENNSDHRPRAGAVGVKAAPPSQNCPADIVLSRAAQAGGRPRPT